MSGIPRIPVRHIPCAQCGTEFGQTAYELRVKTNNCPACMAAFRKSRNLKAPRKTFEVTRHLEILLPKRPFAYYWKKKGQYYLRVEVRKKGSNEEFKYDRIWLGVGKEVEKPKVQAALLAAYARLQMQGVKTRGAEGKPKPLIQLRRAHDRNMGIRTLWVRKKIYKVYLPNPLVDKERIFVGKYSSLLEAREARGNKYREIKYTHIPCAVCGMMPQVNSGALTHFSSACPNRVQMPDGVRPLLQSKLWNLIYSTGEQKNVGKLVSEQLAQAGFLWKSVRQGKYIARTDVEWDFSLAKSYAVKPEEEEIGFE